MTECISKPCSEVSCDSARCTGGECETETASLVHNPNVSEAQPVRGVLAPQSQPDSQTTSLPVFSEDTPSSDVLKSVLVCLAYCATVMYAVLNPTMYFSGLKFACLLPACWIFAIVTVPTAYSGLVFCTARI